jgi:hypothetical protein
MLILSLTPQEAEEAQQEDCKRDTKGVVQQSFILLSIVTLFYSLQLLLILHEIGCEYVCCH